MAWIFIILSGFGTIITILQNIMIQVIFNTPEMQEAFNAPITGSPPFVTFLLSYLKVFAALMLVYTASIFVSSIGLLKRRNWARLLFIGLMGFSILWTLVGVVLQFMMLPTMQADFASIPNTPDMSLVLIITAIFSAFVALAFGVLFGWIAKRLLSPSIAVEFKH